MRDVPVEPPSTTFTFPPGDTADERGRVVVGGDLEPGTLLTAYRCGLFPMRQPDGQLAWWCPDPRAVLPLDRVRVTRSLARSRRRFATTVDAAFEAVVDGCAERGADEYAWITTEIRDAYTRLHRLGWAHSVETWTLPTDGEPARLVGGLYGVCIGGLFGGESMFHRVADASKVALLTLVNLLRSDGHEGAGRLVDVQWMTAHLASLGAVDVSRAEYLRELERALEIPPPPAFG